MSFQFSNPIWLLALPTGGVVDLWLFWKSDVQIGTWRRWTALVLRLLVLLALCFAAAGLQRRKPQEGMTVYYMLDRSQSIPSSQQDAERAYVNKSAKTKKANDKAGVLVFGGRRHRNSAQPPGGCAKNPGRRRRRTHRYRQRHPPWHGGFSRNRPEAARADDGW